MFNKKNDFEADTNENNEQLDHEELKTSNAIDDETVMQDLDQPDSEGKSAEPPVESIAAKPAGSKIRDPLDPKNLRLEDPNDISIKKIITTVRCRKPEKQEFFRVHKDPSYQVHAAILEDKKNRETYMVMPEIAYQIPLDITPALIVTVINRDDEVSLWPLKRPGDENSWNKSAVAASDVGRKSWCKLTANMKAGYYEVYEATGKIAEPEWPELSFHDLLKLCFQNRFIDSLDHPFLRSLRGEI